jgi:hypothetical protein
MSVTLTAQGISFNDGSTQTTNTLSYDAGKLVSITQFTSSGTYTVPSGCYRVLAKVIGGGGGSAGYCESGGAGGYSEALVPVTPGQQIGVTVGGGGGGVGYYAGAGAGGTSSFGSYCSASGGYGANNNYSHTGGHGGSGSGGFINLTGGGGTGHGNGHGSGGIAKGGYGFWGGPMARRHSGAEVIGSGAVGAGAAGGITDSGNNNGGGCTANTGMVVVYAYT